MIEIICDGGDNKGEKENSVKAAVIRRPKNIKQIGDVSSGKQIYIEDYAFTYINSIAHSSQSEEQAGVLLGEFQKNDEEKCVFIKGVVKARFTDSESGICFNENVWNGIYNDIEKYFPDLQVVGWFAIMPHVMEIQMRRLKKIHLDNFSGNMKVLYLMDMAEKEENFYLYDKDELKRQKGYVCFYERNCEMQEYMLERKIKKSSEEAGNDLVMKSIRNVIQEKEEVKQHKRVNSYRYGITALMVTAVLVTTINLMNNYQRMQNFDRSIKKLSAQVADGQTNESQIGQDEDGAVAVNKLQGDVYPSQAQTEGTTQKSTESQSEAQTEAQTEAATEPVTEATEAPKPVSEPVVYTEYTVKQGDTIMSICKEHYGTITKYEDVLAVNNLDNPDVLHIGEIIKLP